MEGTTPQHFDAFASSIRDYQHLLSSSSDPLSELDVKRFLKEGLSSHMLVLDVENALEQKVLTLYTISVADLIALMSKRVTVCAAQLAAFQSHQAASRPFPRPAPAQASRPNQARPAQTPIKAISAAPAPVAPAVPPTAAEAQAWLDNTLRLPPGLEGARAREYLRQRGLCFRCRQQGHISLGCPTFQAPVASLASMPPQTPAQPSPLAPPGPTQESVPLLYVQARLSADGPSYQTLVD
ncbi:hypothetical protein L198_08319 [Cryptococcus wingfieldii CBS 7118]|uniref:CCHC-type domain-containing protein n=1 Tax=Cryptococcus wingfieldii CBS 7118 TaxID=1295528 RepID=A0A1E3H8K6_9TREE|nr:hypothetical protein L198_08319 [Cryptococcus wingfieldii CBS 7118]ODN72660.1 hypothetical protein L198_08319 [Cryptococcus wingfieldii CBS 7118]